LDMMVVPDRMDRVTKGAKNYIERTYANASFRESLPVLPQAVLDKVADALRVEPHRVLLYNETPYCITHDCTCSVAQARWWEMQAKNRACFDAIERDEARGGFTYDWILKTRADTGDLVRDFAPPQTMRSALSRSALNSKNDRMFMRAKITPCNGMMDMHALMPRPLAPVYFNMTKASCTWQRCLERRYAFDPKFVKGCLMEQEENVIVEWVLWHGIDIAMLPFRPSVFEDTLCGSKVDSSRLATRARAFGNESLYQCEYLDVNNSMIGGLHRQHDSSMNAANQVKNEELNVQLFAQRAGLSGTVRGVHSEHSLNAFWG